MNCESYKGESASGLKPPFDIPVNVATWATFPGARRGLPGRLLKILRNRAVRAAFPGLVMWPPLSCPRGEIFPTNESLYLKYLSTDSCHRSPLFSANPEWVLVHHIFSW